MWRVIGIDGIDVMHMVDTTNILSPYVNEMRYKNYDRRLKLWKWKINFLSSEDELVFKLKFPSFIHHVYTDNQSD